MRSLTFTAIALFLSLGLPSVANAKDLSGRFAIGGMQNSLGQQGLSVKYWVGHLGFNMLFGGTSVSTPTKGEYTDEDGDKKSYEGPDGAKSIQTSMRILFNAARAKDVNMYVGGGIGVGSVSQDYANPDPDNPAVKDTSATEVGFELFLGAEYFLSNHFAVQAEVGVPMRFVSEDGPALGGAENNVGVGADSTAFGFFLPSTWAAGFSFYF